ncbi:MutS-related protein [Methylomagnum sp.]
MKEIVNPLYVPLLQSDAKEPPAIRGVTPGGGENVIDASTFQSIEVDKLFDSVNHATTLTGQATLYRSLARPLASGDLIRAKQDAVREIESNEALRKGLELLLQQAKALEKDFYDLLFGSFMGMFSSPAHTLEIEGYGYATYIRGTRFMLSLVDAAHRLPVPESEYLRILVDDLKDFAKSRAYALAHGPAYRTEKGMATQAEKGWFTPGVRFRPSLFKPVGLAVMVLVILLLMEFIPVVFGMFGSLGPAVWLFMLPMALLYIPIVGGFDRDGCIYPLRDIFKKSRDVQNFVDSLGMVDELMSFIRLKEGFGHPMVLPTVVDADQHCIVLKDVRNPILGKGNPDYVPNDLALKEARLTLVTGPNSGGKTAFCKTLAQTQLLAQIGGYVPAEQAELSAADRIYYQMPEISHLADGEGRFGTELRRTKDIFLATTPKSLVIMDELSEGTTHEEKIEISMNILDGFRQKGNNTILITHNHELVDRFQQKKIGLARQVEFKNDQPTYRLIEGISRVSHADRVAKKIGFSKEDIARYLTGKA